MVVLCRDMIVDVLQPVIVGCHGGFRGLFVHAQDKSFRLIQQIRMGRGGNKVEEIWKIEVARNFYYSFIGGRR